MVLKTFLSGVKYGSLKFGISTPQRYDGIGSPTLKGKVCAEPDALQFELKLAQNKWTGQNQHRKTSVMWVFMDGLDSANPQGNTV